MLTKERLISYKVFPFHCGDSIYWQQLRWIIMFVDLNVSIYPILYLHIIVDHLLCAWRNSQPCKFPVFFWNESHEFEREQGGVFGGVCRDEIDGRNVIIPPKGELNKFKKSV